MKNKMEDLCSENVADSPQNGGTIGGGRGGGEGSSGLGEEIRKRDNTVTQPNTSDASNVGSPGRAKKSPPCPMVTVPLSPSANMVSPNTEAPEGVALKVSATMLQPLCLGDSPVMMPLHLLQQMAGGTAPQGMSPYLLTHQGPLSLGSLSPGSGFSLPLVLEQQVFQHLNPMGALLQQTPGCPSLSFLQNNLLCQTQTQNSSVASLAFCQPSSLDQKLPGAPAQDPGLHALLQNPAFAALLQELCSAQTQNHPAPPACHPAGPALTDPYASAAFPPPPGQPTPPLSYPYASPLAPLVPPATLLVPYPVIVPLPVPLPIPLPIPVPQSQDSKAFADPPKPSGVATKSTQTNPEENTSPPVEGHAMAAYPMSSLAALPSVAVVPEGEVLDLSVKAPPIIQPKQEVAFQRQDDAVLDLSVARKQTCIQAVGRKERASSQDWHASFKRTQAARHPSPEVTAAVSLELLRPADSSQKPHHRHPSLLNSLAHVEFSRQRQWAVVDGANGSSVRANNEPKSSSSSSSSSSNFEIFHTSQTAKVIVAVKDAIPATAIFCGKIKALSGVSSKNLSIKQQQESSGHTGALLQQCYSALPLSRGHVEQKDPNVPRNRQAIKLKKVGSQEIHILPLKKQRLAAFFPRK